MGLWKKIFGATDTWADKAEAAINRKDYAAALRLIRPRADKGDPEAQFKLGALYLAGAGVRKDAAQGVSWLRKAAENGSIKAQTNLGMCFVDGEGVKKNLAEAVNWLLKAAEEGDPGAQHNLAFVYSRGGDGVKQDHVLSYKWYSLAAAGWSIPESVAAAGSSSETELRNSSLRDRSQVAAKMTSEQVAEAEALTREWKPKSER